MPLSLHFRVGTAYSSRVVLIIAKFNRVSHIPDNERYCHRSVHTVPPRRSSVVQAQGRFKYHVPFPSVHDKVMLQILSAYRRILSALRE